VDTSHSPYAHWRTLPIGSVSLTGGLWARRQAVNREVSLRHGYRALEQAGNLRDLRLAAGSTEGEYLGPLYIDSDLYKWLEALAWELARHPDDELQRMADTTIELVAAAQAGDGYLNSYYQVVEPDHRWGNLKDGHELYCAGHLMQAAVAHHRVSGDTRLLRVARRLAETIGSVFGPGKRAGTPGHSEIEMALVELYRETAVTTANERRYLELAGFFLDQRGRGLLGSGRYGNLTYYQDHVPVREATAVAGHAVRQLYLAAGVTDVYLETGEQALLDAVARQWRDMTGGKLYVTGGAGSRHEGEAFGEPYELPNDRCYCETCAAIASIMWNWRMLLATGEARFADLIERTLYNGFLSGVSLDGRRFFYVNPLLSRGGIERAEWYRCACCPPNVMRLIASLGHYFATGTPFDGAHGRPARLQIHQYAPATIHAELEPGRRVALRMETDYPWQGQVRLTIGQTDGLPWILGLRLPGWREEASIQVNGEPVEAPAKVDFVTVERVWRKGDTIELDFPMTPRLVEAHPRSDSTRGCVAIERGPIVYCLEQNDQEPPVDIMDVQIDETSPLQTVWRGDLLGGVMTVEARGYAVDVGSWQGRLYRPAGGQDDLSRQPVRLTAVPYHVWANRGPGAMRVWIPRSGRDGSVQLNP
jgi:DUF1680 family protein